MRTLYAGAGLALAAGVLLGGAMRPQLVGDDRPAGPQIFAGWSGERSTGPFDDGGLAFASYSGEIPEYVMGTDWRRMVAQPVVMAEPVYAEEDYYEPPAYDDLPEPEAQPAIYVAEAPSRVAYPSLDGGAAYDDLSRAERTPTARPEITTGDIDPEAPPEATGDTTAAR